MDINIASFHNTYQKQFKDFILCIWKEFRLIYIPELDADLDDPEKFYITPGGALYLLTDKGKIHGTIGVINKGNNVAELKRFYVDKDYRGKGYGTQLLDKAIIFCKENKFNKIAFETGKEFKQGHELYLKKGFKIVKEDEKDYYMELTLSSFSLEQPAL